MKVANAITVKKRRTNKQKQQVYYCYNQEKGETSPLFKGWKVELEESFLPYLQVPIRF